MQFGRGAVRRQTFLSRQINLGPLGLAWASATFEYGAKVDRARRTSSGGASPLTWSSAGHKRVGDSPELHRIIQRHPPAEKPRKPVRLDFGWLHKTIVCGIAGTVSSRGVRS
jgi:hypothetical protein